MQSQMNMDEQQIQRVRSLVGIAMVASLFIYAAIVEALPSLIPGFSGFAPTMPIETLRYALAGLSLLLFIVALVMRQKMVPGMDERQPARPERKLEQARKQLAISLVGMALIENIALFGLVLFLVGADRMDFYTFAAPSLVLMILFFPRRPARTI
jgi:F0F1-type ATP synthase membrane subunit c/vacuolar-type H+-ATPase subunit K